MKLKDEHRTIRSIMRHVLIVVACVLVAVVFVFGGLCFILIA